jgi:hypothetical protein
MTLELRQHCDGVSLCDESSIVYPKSHGKPARRIIEAVQIGERSWSKQSSCFLPVRTVSRAALLRWAIPKGAQDWEHAGSGSFTFTVFGHGNKEAMTFTVADGLVSAVHGVETLKEADVTQAGKRKAKTVIYRIGFRVGYPKAPSPPRPDPQPCQTT